MMSYPPAPPLPGSSRDSELVEIKKFVRATSVAAWTAALIIALMAIEWHVVAIQSWLHDRDSAAALREFYRLQSAGKNQEAAEYMKRWASAQH